MKQTVLYIATSLDGFIARPDGNLDWLTSMPLPEPADDYGYSELLNSIDCTIMGRKTYEEILRFGGEWPYKGIESFVATSQKDYSIQSPDTFLLTENLRTHIQKQKLKSDKDIWIIGGGELITRCLLENVIDKMIITIIPKIIGEGIPLFAPTPPESKWKLSKMQSWNTGVVSLTYEKGE